MADNHHVVARWCERGYFVTEPLYQYNYGQILTLEGFDLPEAFEVHFSSPQDAGRSVTQIGHTVAGVSEVTIPDACLLKSRSISAWLFLHDAVTDGETRFMIEIPVRGRALITGDVPTPVEQSAITQAIAALNTAVEETADAQEAAEAAQAAAEAAQGAAETAQAGAVTAKSAAETARDAAETAHAGAEACATSAGDSAAAAAGRAAAAEAAQTAAETARSAAQSAAGESDQSASAAAQSANQAAQSASAAAGSASGAAGSASTAQTAAQTAGSHANDAESSKAAAAGSASAAAGSASAASGSAGAAATSAGQAAQSATAAAGSATAAAGSASAAAQSAQDAEETVADVTEELGLVKSALEDVAQEVTAQDIKSVLETITELIRQIIEEGAGGGDLNGFSLLRGAGGEVILSYTNPDDETETESVVMPTGTTQEAILAEMQNITESLEIWAGGAA